MKNVSILIPKSEFTSEQFQKLSFSGNLSFIESGKENDLAELVRISKGADLIAFPADSLGKKASEWLETILEKAPTIKAVALDKVQASCVNHSYCKEHEIVVTTIPDDHTLESEAEQVLGLVIASAKRILLNDRRTYRRKYQLEVGFNLQCKTLGIINANKVGQRVATLAKAFGMRVFMYSEEMFRMQEMERKSLDEVLYRSDIVTLHVPNTEENKKFLNKERIERLKQNAIVINIAGRELVDEKEMSKALLEGRVSQYLFEGDSLHKSPLEDVETAIMLKPFSKLTTDSKVMNREWLAKNVLGLSTGKPHNRVIL